MPSHTVIQCAIVRADLAILAAGRCALLAVVAVVIVTALQSMRHSGNPRRSQRAERAAQGTAAERTTAPSTTPGGRPRRGATAGGKRRIAAATPSRTNRTARRGTSPTPRRGSHKPNTTTRVRTNAGAADGSAGGANWRGPRHRGKGGQAHGHGPAERRGATGRRADPRESQTPRPGNTTPGPGGDGRGQGTRAGPQ